MAKYSDEVVAAALRPRSIMRRYPFPGAPGIEVGIKLLSDLDLDSARLQAVDLCSKKLANLVADPEFLDRLIQRQIVARAFLDPEREGHAFFADQSEVASLDNLTVRSLYELYQLHAQSMDPLAFCPLEEVEELAETISKSENGVGLLSLYGLETLRSLLLSSVLRLREMSLTLKSSTG